MAVESLFALGLATVFLVLVAWYASTHRAEDKKTCRSGKNPK